MRVLPTLQRLLIGFLFVLVFLGLLAFAYVMNDPPRPTWSTEAPTRSP